MRKLLNPFFFSLMFVVACNKPMEVDDEIQSVVDDAIAEQEFMAVPPAVMQCAVNSTRTVSYRVTEAGCDTLTYVDGDTLWNSPTHLDPTYTMPVSGCPNVFQDGKTRSGSLKIRMTGRLHTAGTKMIIKFSDYVSNDIYVSCDSMVVTIASLDLNAMEYNISIVNGFCKTSDYTIKLNMERTFGSHELMGSNPYVQVYGTASGVNRENRNFTVNIPQSNPLTKLYTCAYIGKGTMELTPEGFKMRTVDFGDGTCDENASFSVNGNTVAFKLK